MAWLRNLVIYNSIYVGKTNCKFQADDFYKHTFWNIKPWEIGSYLNNPVRPGPPVGAVSVSRTCRVSWLCDYHPFEAQHSPFETSLSGSLFLCATWKAWSYLYHTIEWLSFIVSELMGVREHSASGERGSLPFWGEEVTLVRIRERRWSLGVWGCESWKGFCFMFLFYRWRNWGLELASLITALVWVLLKHGVECR